jgi:hypothetical protein
VRNLLQSVRSWLGGEKAGKPEPVPEPRRPSDPRSRDYDQGAAERIEELAEEQERKLEDR